MSALYRFIHAEKANHPVVLLCTTLHVARSSYYARREGEAARYARRAADDALMHEITMLLIASRRTYGVPRIHAELQRLERRVNGQRSARVMRERDIRGVTRRKRRSLTRPDGKTKPTPDLTRRSFREDSSAGYIHALCADDRQQPQRLLCGRAGLDREEHDLLVPAGDVEEGAVEGDGTDQRVIDGLEQGGLGAHVVRGPQPGELRAAGEEVPHQRGHLAVVGVAGGGGAQAPDRGAGERLRVERVVQRPLVRRRCEVGTAHEVALAPGQGGKVLQEGGQIVPGDHLVGRGEHDRRSVRQSPQQVEDALRHFVRGPGRRPGRRAGEVVQMVALGVRQAQGSGQAGEYLARGARTAGLLKARVVLGRNERQLRHLLAAQPRCAAARPGGQTHVGRGDVLAPATQKAGQLLSVHTSSVRGCCGADPGTAGVWIGSAAGRRLAAMDNAQITDTAVPVAEGLQSTVVCTRPVPARVSAHSLTGDIGPANHHSSNRNGQAS